MSPAMQIVTSSASWERQSACSTGQERLLPSLPQCGLLSKRRATCSPWQASLRAIALGRLSVQGAAAAASPPGHQWRRGRHSCSSRLTTAKAVKDARDHLPSAHASVQRCHWHQARDRWTRTAMLVMPEARALGRRVPARLRESRHGPARMGQERGQGACRMERGRTQKGYLQGMGDIVHGC